ncbi:exopolyphosphatase-like protein [Rhizodiscina lignyota]|uniref:Exopolyphosphatase-like protein n=1 Tax=Rhizodiscina lignyota TaxID=1504668 RepID=A0A9P4I7Q4_9PEZI|nr:exopolyphosphatase-like protein [Rhizodiscina lignyota]
MSSSSLTPHLKRLSIRDFLLTAHAEALHYAIKEHEPVTIVTGNESADLDSMTSALVYAYIRSCAPPKNSFGSMYVPIVAIPRHDLSVRPEFTALLKYAGVKPIELPCLDDIPPGKKLLKPKTTHWVLVDHNALSGRLGEVYSDNVVGCVDHHVDEGKVPKDAEKRFGEPRVIEKTGSCTSLVVRYLQDDWDKLSRGAQNEVREWDAQLAKLAMGSILIDTRDLEDEGKVTDDDQKAVEYLLEKIHAAGDGDQFDRHKFYDEIDKAKKNLESLSISDILRKDYKEWTEKKEKIGISCVVKPITWMKKKADSEAKDEDGQTALLERMRKYAKERDLDIFGLMTTFTDDDGNFRRELMIWALDKDVVDAAKKFQKTSADGLGLEEWKVDGGMDEENSKEWRRVWWQRKVEHSRKRVAPLLREAVKES